MRLRNGQQKIQRGPTEAPRWPGTKDKNAGGGKPSPRAKNFPCPLGKQIGGLRRSASKARSRVRPCDSFSRASSASTVWQIRWGKGSQQWYGGPAHQNFPNKPFTINTIRTVTGTHHRANPVPTNRLLSAIEISTEIGTLEKLLCFRKTARFRGYAAPRTPLPTQPLRLQLKVTMHRSNSMQNVLFVRSSGSVKIRSLVLRFPGKKSRLKIRSSRKNNGTEV